MKVLDLFSGIGGFALAARWAGMETIQFVEKDEFCQKVLMKNFPNVPIHDDIKTFDFYKDVDVLTGGFPCQPFSVAGKKKGLLDDRYLWPDMFRLIRQCKPRFIVAENVPGIVPMLDPILEDLETEGYQWRAYLIPASAIGAPHKRERLWIIAYRDSERCDSGANIGEKRPLQNDWQRYVEAIHTEWPQFVPESWAAFKAQDWLGFATDSDSDHSNQRAKDNATCAERPQWKDVTSEIITCDPKFNWQKDQPPIPGVDDGLPNGVDRNKALGNAIVPQIAYVFLRAIRSTWNMS